MYEDLETLANLKFGKSVADISKELEKQQRRVTADLSSRGLALSGPMEAARIRFRVDRVRQLCIARSEIWADLIIRRDGGLTEAAVKFITEKVKKIADGAVKSTALEGLAGWAQNQARGEIPDVVGPILRDLEIRRREHELNRSNEANAQSTKVFVVMAARKDLESLYSEAIEPAIRDNGLSAFLMTAREPQETISGAILAHIGSARLLVADLTYEKPNCYYEVGYAHGKDKKVILTTREDHDPRRSGRKEADHKIHFDLDNHRISFWREGDWNSLRAELRDRIAEALQKLQTGATRSARIGEPGEEEVLNHMRAMQRVVPRLIVFSNTTIGQELGWPIEDVQLILGHLEEKGFLKTVPGEGYSLTGNNP